MSKRLSVVLAVWCITGVTGCASLVIVAPQGAQAPAASPVSVPVNIEITKSVYGRSFVVSDGTTTTNVSGFNTSIKPGTQNTEVLTTTLSLPPGSYTLTASGTYNEWTGQVTPISRTSSFTVTTADTDIHAGSVGPLVVRRNGGSANLTATITRTPRLRGAGHVVSAQSTDRCHSGTPPAGMAGTVTIPAGMTTGTLAFTANAAADYGDRTVTLRADGGGVTRTTTFTLRVFHATGSFSKAPFAVRTPPQTAISSNGAVRVSAVLGTAEGLPSAYAAVYDRIARRGEARTARPLQSWPNECGESGFWRRRILRGLYCRLRPLRQGTWRGRFRFGTVRCVSSRIHQSIRGRSRRHRSFPLFGNFVLLRTGRLLQLGLHACARGWCTSARSSKQPGAGD